MYKLLLTILPIILIGCSTPPKPPAISGTLEPVNKHRTTVTVDEKSQPQANPPPQTETKEHP